MPWPLARLWAPEVTIGNEVYVPSVLLNEWKRGKRWYAEPHFSATLVQVRATKVQQLAISPGCTVQWPAGGGKCSGEVTGYSSETGMYVRPDAASRPALETLGSLVLGGRFVMVGVLEVRAPPALRPLPAHPPARPPALEPALAHWLARRDQSQVQRVSRRIRGTFRHDDCARFCIDKGTGHLSASLTCSACASIGEENDFVKRLKRRSAALLAEATPASCGNYAPEDLGLLPARKGPRPRPCAYRACSVLVIA